MRVSALVMAAVLGCGPSFGAEPLRVPVFDIPPYGMLDARGDPVGLYVELTRAIAIESGYVPIIELMPFARVLAQLAAGASDLSISFPTPNSTNTLQAVAPVMTVDAIVVPRKALVARSKLDFAGRTIGRIRGGCIDMANTDELRLEFLELNGFTEGLRLLALGRIDGLCTTRAVFHYYRNKDGWRSEDFAPPVLISRREAWLFLRGDAPDLMKTRLRDGLRSLRRQKVLTSIVDRYSE